MVRRRITIRLQLLAFLAALNVQPAPLMFSISGDDMGVPRRLQQVSDAGAAAVFDIGDGSVGFAGLAYDASGDRFYSVANDSVGSSTLVSIPRGGGGNFTPLFSLGTGFLGGLTLHPGEGALYALSNDSSGNSALNRLALPGSSVTPVASLGAGFYGGLAFRSVDALLYGISLDSSGAATLQRIDLTGGGSVFPLLALGEGFYGGLTWDATSDRFYAIASDNNGFSRLYGFGFSGPVSPVADLGFGFNSASLTLVTDIPEPHLWLPIAAAAIAGVLFRRRQR